MPLFVMDSASLACLSCVNAEAVSYSAIIK